MKLELGHIHIHDIQFDSVSRVENFALFVNAEELRSISLDENIQSVSFEIARPGSIRILP